MLTCSHDVRISGHGASDGKARQRYTQARTSWQKSIQTNCHDASIYGKPDVLVALPPALFNKIGLSQRRIVTSLRAMGQAATATRPRTTRPTAFGYGPVISPRWCRPVQCADRRGERARCFRKRATCFRARSLSVPRLSSSCCSVSRSSSSNSSTSSSPPPPPPPPPPPHPHPLSPPARSNYNIVPASTYSTTLDLQ